MDPFVFEAKPLTDKGVSGIAPFQVVPLIELCFPSSEWVQERDRLLKWLQKMWADDVRSEKRRIIEARYLSLE